MPKIKGWDKRIRNSSPSKDGEYSHLLARWVSIYGDVVEVGRTYDQERFDKLDGTSVVQRHFLSGDELDEDQDKWYVRKEGAATPMEYYSTRKEAMDAAKEEIRGLYPDQMIDRDLEERRNF